MTTIYVLTRGEYSDYGIEGVFSSKEKAQKFIDDTREDGEVYSSTIEEWELDVRAGEILRTLYRYELPSGRSWIFKRTAQPNVRSPEEQRGAFVDLQGTLWSWGDSFVDLEHAKKLAEESMQAYLRHKADSVST